VAPQEWLAFDWSSTAAWLALGLFILSVAWEYLHSVLIVLWEHLAVIVAGLLALHMWYARGLRRQLVWLENEHKALQAQWPHPHLRSTRLDEWPLSLSEWTKATTRCLDYLVAEMKRETERNPEGPVDDEWAKANANSYLVMALRDALTIRLVPHFKPKLFEAACGWKHDDGDEEDDDDAGEGVTA
jgi:hypothetical protein